MFWIWNLVAYIINAVVVAAASFGALGATNSEVSDDNTVLITPADWAFSIWSLIFLSELIFVVWQSLPSNRNDKIIVEGISFWFGLACILQAAWSYIFAQELITFAAVVLVCIAASLAAAVIRLSYYRMENRDSSGAQCWPSKTFWLVHFPIGLHGGWVLAASLVNINLALDDPSLRTEVTALIVCLVIAFAGAAAAAVIFMDQIYLLSIAWALGAIADEQDYRQDRLGFDIAAGVTDAITGLWVLLLIIAALSALEGIYYRRSAARRETAGREEEARRRRDAPRERGQRVNRWDREQGNQPQRSLAHAI